MKKMLNEGNQIHNFIFSSGSDFLTSSGSTTLPACLYAERPQMPNKVSLILADRLRRQSFIFS